MNGGGKTTIERVLEKTRVLLLDMDGTIYVGETPIGAMGGTLSAVRASGRKIVYCTNNSSRTAAEYREKLKRLGLWSDDDLVYTSGMAAAEFLAEKFPGKKVYLVGTDALKGEFAAAGIELCEEGADVCVLAYDTSLTFEKLVRLNEYIVEGKPYIATHPDAVCPARGVYPPDVGSFIALLKVSSGREPDVICGKPFKTMGERLCARLRVSADEVLMAGDRPHTDIRFGNRNGFHTLLVLSGETDAQKASTLTGTDRPELILNSLNDIAGVLERKGE